MKMQPGGRSPQSTGLGPDRAMACDQTVKTSMPDRSISKKTTKTSVAPNTVIVLCAILVLIAALALLESHIRSIDHAQSFDAGIGSHSPKEAWRDTEARRTDGETWMALDKSRIDG
jgi:hypothetical protein